MHRYGRTIKNLRFGGNLARGAPADEHRMQPEVVPQSIADRRPAVGQPVLLRLARRHDDRRDRTVELVEKPRLPRALLGPWAELPHRLAVRHAERVEEFEILILHVLPFAGWN